MLDVDDVIAHVMRTILIAEQSADETKKACVEYLYGVGEAGTSRGVETLL